MPSTIPSINLIEWACRYCFGCPSLIEATTVAGTPDPDEEDSRKSKRKKINHLGPKKRHALKQRKMDGERLTKQHGRAVKYIMTQNQTFTIVQIRFQKPRVKHTMVVHGKRLRGQYDFPVKILVLVHIIEI